jgi:hypothetical protein
MVYDINGTEENKSGKSSLLLLRVVLWGYKKDLVGAFIRTRRQERSLIDTTGEERLWAWLRNCFKGIVSQDGYFVELLKNESGSVFLVRALIVFRIYELLIVVIFITKLTTCFCKLLTDSYSTLFRCGAKAATWTMKKHPMRCRHWRKLTNDRERIQNRNYYAASGGIPRISKSFHRSN